MSIPYFLIASPQSQRLWIRLAVGFALLIVSLVAVVLLSISQFRRLADTGAAVLELDFRRILQVQKVSLHAQGHGGAIARLLTAPREDRELIYPSIDSENARVDGLIAELSMADPGGDEGKAIAELAQSRDRYRTVFADVVEKIEAGNAAGARMTFNDLGQPALRSLLDASNSLLAREWSAIASRQLRVQSEVRSAEWMLVTLTAIAVVLSAFFAWRLTVSVAGPLARMEAAARRIADGDYAVSVESGGSVELSRVASAMNAMARAVAERESRIESLAYVDTLTGLPNRTMLRRVASSGGGQYRALILMDVARFRTVNEVLGFDAGDALLVRTAERIRDVTDRCAQGNAFLAKLAGGVFTIFCVGLDRSAVKSLHKRVDEAMRDPIECEGHSVDVQLVSGFADSLEESDISVDGLLRRAEMALSEAKKTKQSSLWYVPASQPARARQLSLLSDLRMAASTGQLELWLQPKLCLREGRVKGMEGLVRWRHPTQGFVSPGEFIPFAERTGHIGVVTDAMIDAACKKLAEWARDSNEMSIAVNISAVDLQDHGFVSRVEQTALRHGTPVHRLRLELTESSLMDDAEGALLVLKALRQLGVRLSIDDFGTGYSSLAYLNRLPVDELKIDRSFVAGADLSEDARSILRTIVDLGRSLGMSVTAEGVERVEELEMLRDIGCDQVQGYLVSRPMGPDAIEPYLHSLASRKEIALTS